MKIQSSPDETGHRYFTFDPVYWQSVMTFLDFSGNELEKLELVPITLGFGKPRSQRGRPVLANLQEARSIIDQLRTLSEPWGTSIKFEEGKGIVDLRK